MQSIIANAADGARLRVVGDVVRVLASSQQTGGAGGGWRLRIESGSSRCRTPKGQ